MSRYQNTYQTTEISDELSAKYIFISRGYKDVIKVVEYQYVEPYDNGHLYNLAFGDYDIENDIINDLTDTNNGDHYAVFNTVLNTISAFLINNPSAIIMVQGSDTRQEYVDKCKETLERNVMTYVEILIAG